MESHPKVSQDVTPVSYRQPVSIPKRDPNSLIVSLPIHRILPDNFEDSSDSDSTSVASLSSKLTVTIPFEFLSRIPTSVDSSFGSSSTVDSDLDTPLKVSLPIDYFYQVDEMFFTEPDTPVTSLFWSRILLKFQEPFMEVFKMMSNSNFLDNLSISQLLPLTLLSTVSTNKAVFIRFDYIHFRRHDALKQKLFDLLLLIQTRDWLRIDWDWSLYLNNVPVLDRAIDDTLLKYTKDPFCLNFAKTIDITELANYLYLTFQIDSRELLFVHFLKHLHFSSDLNTSLTNPNFPILRSSPRAGDSELDVQHIPFYLESNYAKVKFNEFFSNALTHSSSPLVSDVYRYVFDTYGFNLYALYAQDGSGIGCSFKYDIFLTQLFVNLTHTALVPTLGAFPIDYAYAYSLVSAKHSGKLSRFVFLPHPNLFNIQLPHQLKSFMSVLGHDAFHLKRLESVSASSFSELLSWTHEKSLKDFIEIANRYYPESLSFASPKHLTDDYGFCF